MHANWKRKTLIIATILSLSPIGMAAAAQRGNPALNPAAGRPTARQPGARQPAAGQPAQTPRVRGAAADPNNPAPGQPAATPRAGRQPGVAGAVTADAPTVVGKVSAFEAGKSITIETRRRGGDAQTTEYRLAGEQTKIELLGETKAIEVGMPASVWAAKDDAKVAARVVAGTPVGRGTGRTPNPNPNPRRPANPATPTPATPRKRAEN